MSGLNGRIGNVKFRCDPDSVAWNFSVKTKVTNTLGGQVVQVFGVKLGEMTLSGSFGRGGFDEQVAFVNKVQTLSRDQARGTLAPHRFVLPSRKWDFQVYVRGMTTPDGNGAAHIAPDIINPRWTLRLFIVEDNADLKKAASDAYIARLSAGIGWKPGPFNGPMTAEEANAAAALAATKHHPPVPSGGGGAAGAAPGGTPQGQAGPGLYPAAVNKLLPEDAGARTITPRIVILHSAAGKGSLFPFFGGKSNLESHFWVAEDGTVEQYMNTNHRADANLSANAYAISIETESTTMATEPWTPQQVASLIKLVKWCCDSHAIPKSQVQTHDGAGIGWHIMFGAPGPWTPSSKTCPGPARIIQARDEIIPAVAKAA